MLLVLFEFYQQLLLYLVPVFAYLVPVFACLVMNSRARHNA